MNLKYCYHLYINFEIFYSRSKWNSPGRPQNDGASFTYGGPHSQGDWVSRVLDEVDDVLVVHVGDIHPIDGQDPVPHMKTPTPLSWTVLYDFTCKTVLDI